MSVWLEDTEKKHMLANPGETIAFHLTGYLLA